MTDPTSPRATLAINLLGGFQVVRNDRPLPESAWLRRSMARTLVKLLAVQPGHRMHRDQVLEMLWPDHDPDSALNSLAKALHAARRALEPDLEPRRPSTFLVLTDDLLTLVTDRVSIDADDFERLAGEALDHPSLPALQAARAAYTGELLPEDRYEDWSAHRRDALAQLYLRVLRALTEELESRGEFSEAIAVLEDIVRADPLEEGARIELMRLLVNAGMRNRALQQYELYRNALAYELDTAPGENMEVLYQDIVSGALQPSGKHVRTESEPAEAALPPPVRKKPFVPLVGRDGVMAILHGDLTQAMGGDGRAILLSGEAGTGKRRIAADLARTAADHGAAVLWSAGYAHQSLAPYGSFVAAIESYLSTRPPEERDDLSRRFPALGRLLPSLTPGIDSQVGPDNVVEGTLAASIIALVLGLAAQQPVVLVFDDLHSTDAATLQILHQLARSAMDHRLLIVGTYRDEEVSARPDFQTVLSALNREDLVRHVTLGRLARADSDRLVESLLSDGQVDDALLHRLYALSLGNPLFTEELVRAMLVEGGLTLVDGRWVVSPGAGNLVPRRIQELVDTRVQGLSRDVRLLLGLAAIGGTEWSVANLRAAAIEIGLLPAGNDEILFNALDRAIDASILEDCGDTFAFRHPLFQAALHNQLPHYRRTRMHVAVARVIERTSPDDVAALAYHYARGGEEGPALRYLALAAERSRMLSANASALSYYEELLDRHQASGRRRDEADTLLHIGDLLCALARYDEAENAAMRSLALYREMENTEGATQALALLGKVLGSRGDADTGARFLEEYLSTSLAAAPPAGMADVYSALGILHFVDGDYAAQLDAAERGIALARQTNEAMALRRAMTHRGCALAHLGRHAEAREILGALIPELEAADDRVFLAAARNGLACTLGHGQRFPEAQEQLQLGLDAAVRSGHVGQSALLTYRLGVNALQRGSLTAAREYFQLAAELAGKADGYWASALSLFGLATVDLLQGVDAEDHIEQLRSYVDAFPSSELAGLYSLAEHEDRYSEAVSKAARQVLDAVLKGRKEPRN